VILLQNIHDKTYIEDISTNMVWCFNLTKVDNCLEAAVEYNALFYKEDTILRVIDHWIFLVLQVLANNDLPISEVSLISGSEKKQLLEMANGPEEPLEMEQTIHGLFEVQAEKSGDGVAVVCMEQWAAHSVTGMGFVGAQGAVPLNGNVHLTYKELNKKSDQLAYLLREKGVQPDTIVGVMVEPCVEMVIAVLAILKTGGCYLPIDPEYPRERISYMLKDGNAKVLLAAPAAQVKVEVKAKAKEKPIELIDISEKFSSFPSTLTLSKVSSANLVYIMYTSGSTGRPKAVMVEHRSVVRLVKNANYIHFQEGDRILQTGSLSFDASTFEIWGALLNGLRLYLAKKEEILDPRRLKNAIKDWNITIIWMTSGLFNWMCQTDVEIFSGLKYLLVGGDVLSPVHINKVRKRYPGLVVINGYGPTENTTFSTTHRIDREYEENIPIGRPITNSSAYILDKNGYPVPIGVVGELVVGGEGVARGYMNRPELTAEKFILAHGSWLIADRREKKVSSSRELPMSYELSAMSCFYKTGDLARWLPEGAIEFLGRKDQQIKIRGQRIELGEIESQLLKHPDLTDAVVVTWTDDAGDLQLCAYVVYRKPTEFTGLREFLAKTLPDYMIPACFVALDKIPLTPNGKVDRKALPKPEVEGRSEYIAPRDEVEKKLVEIWREVLGLGDNTSIGIEDNFFDLGGHSLKATILAAKIHRELDIEIPLTEIFKSPTIR
ncbi:MAG: amino acid adenylation domain-containing protein, partial [Candidatus Aminicenantes bacterium]|nr:amino acid adenylation domain-containing protein [Candidatus Aminicenantes bacterium]NIM81245.1 amino acid adenylation domain-containing protein [Candidatus Aminicenantes bacterium]NIN20631.1 amino acid adenylation domain-containing protein [Candidatus Aminicenantes bacterium]NIN44410.1 amino acid adenylation domain-containing protein [Candidatus Aminicenantes bacterium]NIN87229.1 amino acid adenylation domain-containing protein [Candidatus Aminicenantes bacterium]